MRFSSEALLENSEDVKLLHLALEWTLTSTLGIKFIFRFNFTPEFQQFIFNRPGLRIFPGVVPFAFTGFIGWVSSDSAGSDRNVARNAVAGF